MISMIELEKRVINAGICTGCGACQGMCPYYRSFEGRTYCNFECNRHDGRCVVFCPRMPADLKALAAKYFDENDMTVEMGPVKGLYLTRAASDEARNGAQHGGTMTALVTLALEEGFIDGAVLTKKDGVLAPEGFIAKTARDVASCKGVSFQIAPTLETLNKALAGGEYKSLGVVGTPCKTLAAYKMKSAPYEGNDNNAAAIGMVFGLFCGWGLDWNGFAGLVSKNGGGDHCDTLPSKYHSMELTGKDGVKSIDLGDVLPLVRPACRACYDMTAEFADISVGGARSGDGWDVDKGWNQLIVRSEKGQQLLDIAKQKGILEFKELPEGALDKLKKASASKRATAEKTMMDNFGELGYLG